MQNFNKVFILVRFEINKDYIAKNLCVQKEIKNNCCQGSCHLTKELKAEDKKQQSQGNLPQKDKNDAQLFFQTQMLYNLNRPFLELDNKIPYKVAAMTAFSCSVFHPPC